MSTTSPPSKPSLSPPKPRPALARRPLLWMVPACLAMATSGAVRSYQERQFDQAARSVERPPFEIDGLPERFGPWQMEAEQELGEETLQVAGSTGHMARTYIDERTGVLLSALVVFGPAEQVFGHSPLICFPAFGYDLARAPRLSTIETAVGPVPVRHAIYSKPAGGTTEYQEVFYTFRHAGRWSPDAEATRKQFRHRPAMFKVQVQRPVAPTEGSDSPSEEFLAELIVAIERRLAEVGDGPAATADESETIVSTTGR